jgi:Alpha/beta hydrolase family
MKLVGTFVLIPGAGGVAWYWSHVARLLEAAGHEAIAIELPGDDENAGLPEYTARVVEAIGGHRDVLLVAQSLGGFTAAMVCDAVPVGGLVLVNAMIPIPGETPGAWWGDTGAIQARDLAAAEGGYGDFDIATYFLHDVPAETATEGEQLQRPEADAVFATPCEFSVWPAVPTKVLVGAHDRFFPVAFQQRVARDRLGVSPDVLAGGHLLALARPRSVAAYLLRAAA